MKFTRFIFAALLVVVVEFLFGNSYVALAGKSNVDRPSSIEQNILEQTGMCININ